MHQKNFDLTETLNFIDTPHFLVEVEAIINNLKKRDTLKIFSPLGIKRRVNKIEKNLTDTKAEILALYKAEGAHVSSVLREYLPELFT